MTTPTTGIYLDKILANTAFELGERKQTTSLAELESRLADAQQPLPFAAGLRGTSTTVIAEFKRSSPSKGVIADHVDPVDVALDYVAGGASGISVLTDSRFFQGSLADLERVAAAARPVPVLRKDFVIDEYQIVEAAVHGASAVLLIAACLPLERLEALQTFAAGLGLDALVEIHDEQELEKAVSADAMLIGINNRDLRTFQVDLGVTEHLAPLVPADRTIVGESGVNTNADVQRLAAAGVHAVLVGESLMLAADRVAAIKELRR